MSAIYKSVVTLRISGDDLNPDDITARLGASPTQAYRKGEVMVGKVTGKSRTAKMGMWRLEVQDRQPEDLEGQINELLNKLVPELVVWRELKNHFEMDLFCGLFMNESNEGLELSPEILQALGERGISLGLDIYDGPYERKS